MTEIINGVNLCELVNIHTCVEEALDIFNVFKSSEDFGTEWDDIYDLEACNGLCI